MDARTSPARSTAASMRWSARKPLDDYRRARRSTGSQAWPEAVEAQATARPSPRVRNAPDLTPVISAAVPFERRRAARDRQRPRLHPDRSQASAALIVGAMALADRAFGPAVAVPGADHRPAAAAARARRPPRPPRPGARSQRAAPAVAQRRDRPARPRRVRHEPVAAPADRQYRGLRRRRHPRAQEPARLAALGGRRARPGRGSRASRSS